jgi:hypothetical protein
MFDVEKIETRKFWKKAGPVQFAIVLGLVGGATLLSFLPARI